MKMVKKWSKEEIIILRNNYRSKDNKEISILLNKRSISSIKSKLYLLGLKRDEDFRKRISNKLGLIGHKWSEKSKKEFSKKLKSDYKKGLRISNLKNIVLSDDLKKKKVDKIKKTLKENPSIMRNSVEKRRITLKNNPEIIKNSVLKRKKTFENNLDIQKKISNKLSERFRDIKKDRERRFKIKLKMIENFSKNKEVLFCEVCNNTMINSITNKYNPRFCSSRCARSNQIVPKRDSSIEVKIQNFLKKLGITFFTHQYMKIDHGYQCDIFIPSLNLVIECDGDYWHKYPVGNEIDHVRTSELLEKGFKVLRLWENEINSMSIEQFKRRLKVKE